MPRINFHFVDELIAARQQQHGGGRGAPQRVAGYRIGTSINRSCIVMLSALLQAYVEEVYKECAKHVFPAIAANPDNLDRYWRQMKNWGNPSADNISRLFLQLGIINVFSGLTWQKTTEENIKAKLETINQLRNRIAHGSDLTVDGRPYSLSLVKVQMLRNFADNFSVRFEPHTYMLITPP